MFNLENTDENIINLLDLSFSGILKMKIEIEESELEIKRNKKKKLILFINIKV